MTTDLVIDCMVGLCVAAMIMWFARRRRTHTEGPKSGLDRLDPTQAQPLSFGMDAPAEGEKQDENEHSTLRQLQELATEEVEGEEEWVLEEEEEEDENHDDDDDDVELVVEDTLAEDGTEPMWDQAGAPASEINAMAMAAAMMAQGFSMTESFMAMQEFHVVDTQHLPEDAEEERMRMEDPLQEDDPLEEEEEEDDDESDEEAELEEETQERKEEEHEEPEEVEAPSSVMAAFWVKCANKDECGLCSVPFAFLVRRHHCRKCCASVCSGCSSNSMAMPEFGGSVERVCDRCWASLQADTTDSEEDQGELSS